MRKLSDIIESILDGVEQVLDAIAPTPQPLPVPVRVKNPARRG